MYINSKTHWFFEETKRHMGDLFTTTITPFTSYRGKLYQVSCTLSDTQKYLDPIIYEAFSRLVYVSI